MRKLFQYLLIALSAVAVFTSCSNDDEPEISTENTDDIQYEENRKILVAYFSATGNTQRLAQQIISATGASHRSR